MKKHVTGIIVLLITAFMCIASGCVTSYYADSRYQTVNEAGDDEDIMGSVSGSSAPIFFGYGEGTNADEAVREAVRDAILRAVVEALGDEAVLMQYKAASIASRISSFDTLTTPGSLEIIEKDYQSGIYKRIVKVRVQINTAADYFFLRGVTGGLIDDSSIIMLEHRLMPTIKGSQPLDTVLEPIGYTWDSGWKPDFLVLYDERRYEDSFEAGNAVMAVMDYISSLGYGYIDLEQVESLKQDKEYVFVEEQGYSSMIRWVASRLHAAYYIDTAVDVSTFNQNGMFYAEASVTLSCYNSSTGVGRGTVYYHLDEPVGGSTRKSAINEAIALAVHSAVPELMQKTAGYFVEDAQSGKVYDLTIERTARDSVMREFMKSLQVYAPQVRLDAYSIDETVFSVRFPGNIDQLIDFIYEAADHTTGLDDLYLVLQRGDTLTFNTGK